MNLLGMRGLLLLGGRGARGEGGGSKASLFSFSCLQPCSSVDYVRASLNLYLIKNEM